MRHGKHEGIMYPGAERTTNAWGRIQVWGSKSKEQSRRRNEIRGIDRHIRYREENAPSAAYSSSTVCMQLDAALLHLLRLSMDVSSPVARSQSG